MRKNILVVDDDSVTAEIVTEHLISLGFRATSTMDAKQAMIQAETLMPELVVTDILMPGWGSGIHAYKNFREHPAFKEMPIIFMTSLEPQAARALIPKDPRVRIVYKPLNLTMLEQAIEDLLGRPSPVQAQGGAPPVRVRIRWGGGEVLIQLKKTQCAEVLAVHLPIEAEAQTWGDEVFFKVPFNADLEEEACQVVAPGSLCFWKDGQALALPFGPTPISEGGECRLVDKVNVLGHISGDAKILGSVKPGERILMELLKG